MYEHNGSLRSNNLLRPQWQVKSTQRSVVSLSPADEAPAPLPPLPQLDVPPPNSKYQSWIFQGTRQSAQGNSWLPRSKYNRALRTWLQGGNAASARPHLACPKGSVNVRHTASWLARAERVQRCCYLSLQNMQTILNKERSNSWSHNSPY